MIRICFLWNRIQCSPDNPCCVKFELTPYIGPCCHQSILWQRGAVLTRNPTAKHSNTKVHQKTPKQKHLSRTQNGSLQYSCSSLTCRPVHWSSGFCFGISSVVSSFRVILVESLARSDGLKSPISRTTATIHNASTWYRDNSSALWGVQLVGEYTHIYVLRGHGSRRNWQGRRSKFNTAGAFMTSLNKNNILEFPLK